MTSLEPGSRTVNVNPLRASKSAAWRVRSARLASGDIPPPDGSWPPVGGMSSEANLGDLTRHAADFVARKGFTFTVLEPGSGEVIGCVYLYPTKADGHDVEVQSWVRADRAELDVPLADAVAAWLASDWPWERPERHGR